MTNFDYTVVTTQEFEIHQSEEIKLSMPFAGSEQVGVRNLKVTWCSHRGEAELFFKTNPSNLRIPHAKFYFGNINEEENFNLVGHGPDIRWQAKAVRVNSEGTWDVLCHRIDTE
jgi:hypothetical protein